MTDLQRPKSFSCPRLVKSRSRCPLSVDDVPICERFLSKESQGSLNSVFASCDSGFDSSLQISQNCDDSLSRTQGDVFQLLEEDENQVVLLADEKVRSLPYNTNNNAKTSSISTSKKPVRMEFIFSEINEELGKVWEKLGRNLLKRECAIQNINRDFDGVEEKAYQVLMKWKKEKGSEATIVSLMESLVHIGCTKVAETLLHYADFSDFASHEMVSIDHVPKPLIVYNIDEDPQKFAIQKQLSSKEMVFLWQHSANSKKYVIREVEMRPNVWTARKAIDCKTLQIQKSRLRKTKDFIKDMQAKNQMVNHLLGVVKHLQEHLSTNHTGFCHKGTNCGHCLRVGLQKDLIQNELALLQHELQRMIAGNRRISVVGIPTDRIYNIAERTYTICEEHKALHEQAKSKKCTDTDSSSWDEDEDDMRIEKSLKCTLNIMCIIGRRRKSVQSLKPQKKNKERKKVKRNKSTFYVSLKRDSYLLAQDNPLMIGDLNIDDSTALEKTSFEMKKSHEEKEKAIFTCPNRKFNSGMEKPEICKTSKHSTKKKTPTRTQSCSGVALRPHVSMGTPSHSSSSTTSSFNRHSLPNMQSGASKSLCKNGSENAYGELWLDEVEDAHDERFGGCSKRTSQGVLQAACKELQEEANTVPRQDTPTTHQSPPTSPSSTNSPQISDYKQHAGGVPSLQHIQWMQDLDCNDIICV